MKKLILQTYYHHDTNKADNKVGCYVPADDLAVESEKRFRIYAESIGADYRMINSPPYTEYPQPAWARWVIFDIAIEEGYDQVCYVDADILPSKRSLGVDIFEFDGVAKQTERDEGTKHAWHVNAGVFKADRKDCFKMRSEIHKRKYLDWLEATGKNQDPFNNAWKKSHGGRKPAFLHPAWNMTRAWHRDPAMQEFNGWEPVEGGYWAHYIGHQKLGGNQWGDMKKDPIYKEDWS